MERRKQPPPEALCDPEETHEHEPYGGYEERSRLELQLLPTEAQWLAEGPEDQALLASLHGVWEPVSGLDSGRSIWDPDVEATWHLPAPGTPASPDWPPRLWLVIADPAARN